ncbi:transposase [Sphingomonas sp. BK069]|uniref:IS110 family transposase n=1 Tax=Sphingomonas sp. BK069 TaxID=2586979 RepID=UPI001611052B|nr:transposase [Sphingomonas sp. BK069]MBB3346130.1 transposase [Sphingomonas sp. BK069]
MTDKAATRQRVLGIDVSCHRVTLYDEATGRTHDIANDIDSLHDALAGYTGHALAVCEATGGHEDTLLAALHVLGIPAHRADAAKVKAYIRSFGKRAKTDAIDARWLARYALDRGATLPRWQPPVPAQAELAALVARRLDLVAIKTQESNRLKAPRSDLVAEHIRAHLDQLAEHIARLDARIAALVADQPDLAQRAQALRSVPGIGPVHAPLLLATLPELGTLGRRQAASLAGCAPHPRDSGTRAGPRHPAGGRRQIRPALFIAAMAAARGTNPLADFYRRLVATGKPKRLALAAVMRKIVTIANARLRDLPHPASQLT